MTEVAISLGSNTEDAHEQILASLNWLGNVLNEMRSSDVYTTPALHGDSIYTNAVAIGNTNVPLETLKAMLKQHEADCGRNEETRAMHQVPIDLDVVIYGDEVVKEKDFQKEYFQIGFRSLSPTLP